MYNPLKIKKKCVRITLIQDVCVFFFKSLFNGKRTWRTFNNVFLVRIYNKVEQNIEERRFAWKQKKRMKTNKSSWQATDAFKGSQFSVFLQLCRFLKKKIANRKRGEKIVCSSLHRQHKGGGGYWCSVEIKVKDS